MGIAEQITSSMFTMFSEKLKSRSEKDTKEYEDIIEARKKYCEAVTEIRYGDFCDLGILVNIVNNYIDKKGNSLNKEEAEIIKDLLNKIDLPNEKLHPYEIPIMFDFKLLSSRVDKIINQ